jgi:hypothetical protein
MPTKKSFRKKTREVIHMDGGLDKDFKVGVMKELLQQILYSVDGKINKCIDFITKESTGFFTDTTQMVFKKYLQTEYKNKTASINFIFDSFNRTASRRGAIVSEKPLIYDNVIKNEIPDNNVPKINISDADILSNCYEEESKTSSEESKTSDEKISQKVLKMIEITLEKFQLLNTLVSISSDKNAAACNLKGQASVNVLNLLIVLKKNDILSNLYVERLDKIITELDDLLKK